MCWALLMMGIATLAPSVLLPEWREYQALRLAEQREQHRIEQLRTVIDRERQAVAAIQTDPAVVARLARRDLRYHSPDETPVWVGDPSPAGPAASEFVPQSVDPPRWISAGERFLPRFNYDCVFCDENTRILVMGLSLAILALSMALTPRKSAPLPS